MSDTGAIADHRAVLVGVSNYKYEDLADLPAAGNSLQAMYEVLTDPALCGWPEERVTVIRDPRNAGEVGSQIAALAQRTRGVFLLYYVGHGKVTGRRSEFYLTAGDTDPDQVAFTGLSWPALADALGASPARIRMMILDCCFSGRALDTAVLGTEESLLADLTVVEGVYTLTATTRNVLATAPVFEQQASACTHFTGELCDLVREGLPERPAWLTFGDVYPVLRERLVGKQLPKPDQRNTQTAVLYPFTRNAALPARTDSEIAIGQINTRRLLIDVVKVVYRAIRIALQAASEQHMAEQLAKPAEREPASGGVFSRLKRSVQDQAKDGARATGAAVASVHARHLRERRDVEVSRLKRLTAELVDAIGRMRALEQSADDGLAEAEAHAAGLARAFNAVEGRDLATSSARLVVQQHLRGVNGGLRAFPMDVSGMDLSSVQGLTWRNLRALSGLIWNEDTVWPPRVADLVRERSLQVRPGMYQVGFPPAAAGVVDIDEAEAEAKAEAEAEGD